MGVARAVDMLAGQAALPPARLRALADALLRAKRRAVHHRSQIQWTEGAVRSIHEDQAAAWADLLQLAMWGEP